MKRNSLLWLIGLLILWSGCGRRSPYVSPTGWESLSADSDTLTRAIELSFQNGVGLDSTMALMKRFRKAAGFGREAECRLLYWQGRLEIRRQNRQLGQALFDSACAIAPGATAGYLARIVEWRRERIDDFTPREWYARKLDQARYFESRHDSQMLYNVYRELMEMMRDAGMNDRALHYLALITACNRRIDPAMAALDDKMNRAAILSDMGRDAEAVDLYRDLRQNTGYMREPANCQLVNLNIHNLAGDTFALHTAWRSIAEQGDRADLLPKVYYYLADEALAAGDCKEAQRWTDSISTILPGMGTGVYRVKSLKAIARQREMCDGAATCAAAWREYALAADSLAEQMRLGNPADLELKRAIEETDARLADERRKLNMRLWIIASAAVIMLIAAALILYRWRRRAKTLHLEACKMMEETEHRQLALRLDADRRGLGAEFGSDDFLTLFSKRYPLFIARLRQISPRISDTALRLAGYIAIGLGTKEIAELMNVRPESVRQSKWRLRKTLGLAAEEDLFPLLSSLLQQ